MRSCSWRPVPLHPWPRPTHTGGGEPKCCKSFLALDLAVAVAAGIPCLRRFAVPRAGRVLLFAAEDALHIVRRRFEGISAAASVALADLDIQGITEPTVRVDL